MEEERGLRIAAVSDVHYNRQSAGSLKDLFEGASARADVLAICGDLTDYGLPEEAEILAADLRSFVSIPILAVLGNHDFESGREDELIAILRDAGVKILDGSCTEIDGIGFAGISGFGGGFGQRMLNGWGEKLIKEFVQAAINEELKLEQALSRLEMPQRVALLHYSPIAETVEGEPLEIYPFLGSSRLEEPLNRYSMSAAFHGHAHHGAPEGNTSGGVPIYNVSMPVLRTARPNELPFKLVTVSRSDTKEKGSSEVKSPSVD